MGAVLLAVSPAAGSEGSSPPFRRLASDATVRVPNLDPAVVARCEQLRFLLPAAVRPRVEVALGEVKRLAPAGAASDLGAGAHNALARSFPGLAGTDIDALAEIVMFELWEAEEQDLQEAVDELHRQNEAKRRWRDVQERLRDQARLLKVQLRETHDRSAGSGMLHLVPSYGRTPTLGLVYPRLAVPSLAVPTPRPDLTAVQLQARFDEVNSALDTLDGLTEEIKRKLDSALDRFQKTVGALSNIMTKLSTTAESIVQNIK